MKIKFIEEGEAFPPTSTALKYPNGLLAMTYSLSVERLIEAYSKGIFPWFNEYEPPMWWSPDPRAVLFIEDYQPNKRFIRMMSRSGWTITFNQAFENVIRNCAVRTEGTWITEGIIQTYIEFHKQGFAKSLEVWDQEGKLIGGLYGVLQGNLFCGESMFSRESNASKVAFYHLIQHLKSKGATLVDCQVLNEHTASLGATEIPREHFLTYLTKAKNHTLAF